MTGIGLNVSSAPPGAISLAGATGASVDRGSLLAGLLVALDGWYGRWDDVAATYRERCATVGQTVRAELPDRTVVGVAEGIDSRGHLLVRAVGGELVEVVAGDVIHLRRS